MEADLLANGNRLLLFRGFAFKWKSPLKLVEAHILTNVTDLLASGNHFLPLFQTAVKMEENDSRKRTKMVFTSQKISFH